MFTTLINSDFLITGLLWQDGQITIGIANSKSDTRTAGLRSQLALMSEAEWDAGIVPDDQPPTSSDHALLEQFRKGQMDASTRLYLKYVDRLLGLTS